MPSQKDIFLAGEADAWFARNRDVISRLGYSDGDAVVAAVGDIVASVAATAPLNLLEIGSSNGGRLERLREKYALNVAGIEPSSAAAADAAARGLEVTVGTADSLPHSDGTFDIVVFGFCLYLCDVSDLFRIAAEADRVLKSSGWIIIHDFFATTPTARPYHHRPGVLSRKMDYRTLFDWHPSYACYSHRVGRHQSGVFEDDPNEWVATSVLRRRES